MLQPKTHISNPEQEFIKELNRYLEYPLSAYGQNRVRQMLLEYKAKNTEVKLIRFADPITVSDPTPMIKPVDSQDILRIVSDYVKMPIEKFLKKKRTTDLLYPRYLSTFFIRKYTLLSLKSIGLVMGGKDHTTVIHSLATFKDLALTNENVQADVSNINQMILEFKASL